MIFKTLALLSSLLQHTTGDCQTGDCQPSTCRPDEELRVTKLESLVDHLNRQVSELAAAGVEVETELATSQEIINSLLDECSGKWTLKRTQIVFPELEKLPMSGGTPTFVKALPAPLPNGTRAVIVQVFCNWGNGTSTRAYLHVNIQQEGNEEGGAARVENTNFNAYANTIYYEVLVPWDNTISDKLQFRVTRSYQSGGADNWYRLRVVGYIMA